MSNMNNYMRFKRFNKIKSFNLYICQLAFFLKMILMSCTKVTILTVSRLHSVITVKSSRKLVCTVCEPLKLCQHDFSVSE